MCHMLRMICGSQRERIFDGHVVAGEFVARQNDAICVRVYTNGRPDEILEEISTNHRSATDDLDRWIFAMPSVYGRIGQS